jgi:hypothetical protein
MDPISAALLAGMLGFAAGVGFFFVLERAEVRGLRFDNKVLDHELTQSNEYGFKLLDDQDFYLEQKSIHEETCAPARFGRFGRILEREERA